MVIVRPRFGLWLALLATLSPGVAAAAPARTITKSEIRSDPPDVTDRRLRDVVWSLLERQDYRSNKEPKTSLTRLFLRTKAQPTHVPGLCSFDSLWIRFEPTDRRERGPDAAVRPVGLTSTSNFTFLSAPSADYNNARRAGLGSAGPCSRLPKDQPFFQARDEREATDGYRAWLTLHDSIRVGRKFPLECNLTRSDSGSCEAVIDALKPEQLSEVETCESSPGIDCHAIYVDERLIKIMTTGQVYPGPKPGELVSATLDSLIVLTHEIID
jgi:hypothetical protein